MRGDIHCEKVARACVQVYSLRILSRLFSLARTPMRIPLLGGKADSVEGVKFILIANAQWLHYKH